MLVLDFNVKSDMHTLDLTCSHFTSTYTDTRTETNTNTKTHSRASTNKNK